MRKLLSERDAHVEDHRGTGQGGLTSVADLQAELADKECQLHKLTDENQGLKDKVEQAEAQVHMLRLTHYTYVPSLIKFLFLFLMVHSNL